MESMVAQMDRLVAQNRSLRTSLSTLQSNVVQLMRELLQQACAPPPAHLPPLSSSASDNPIIELATQIWHGQSITSKFLHLEKPITTNYKKLQKKIISVLATIEWSGLFNTVTNQPVVDGS